MENGKWKIENGKGGRKPLFLCTSAIPYMRCGPPRAGRPDGWLTRQIHLPISLTSPPDSAVSPPKRKINSFGGYLKQYEVAVDPDALYSLNITIGEVFEALSRNNQNTGGSYIEKVDRAYYIRSEGMINDLRDVEQIVVTNRGGIPVHIGDIGRVQFGAPRSPCSSSSSSSSPS